MHQFLDNIEAKVDIKGRIFVPAVYRKSLESESEGALYMKIDVIRKCAKLYPKSVWDKMDLELKATLNFWNNEELQIYRQFTSQVERIELDAAGRALIQRRHLDRLEIEGDALFVGVGFYFEIWGKDNYIRSLYNDDDFDKKLEQKMGNKKLIDSN